MTPESCNPTQFIKTLRGNGRRGRTLGIIFQNQNGPQSRNMNDIIQVSDEKESMGKNLIIDPKRSMQTRESLKRRYNGRVQRGVFVHSAVNTAAPGVSMQPCCLLIYSPSGPLVCTPTLKIQTATVCSPTG